MKQKTMIVAAVAVGLWLYFRPRTVYTQKDGVLPAYQMATDQRQASGAAIPQNTDYLKNWADLSQAWGNDPNAWL